MKEDGAKNFEQSDWSLPSNTRTLPYMECRARPVVPCTSAYCDRKSRNPLATCWLKERAGPVGEYATTNASCRQHLQKMFGAASPAHQSPYKVGKSGQQQASSKFALSLFSAVIAGAGDLLAQLVAQKGSVRIKWRSVAAFSTFG